MQFNYRYRYLVVIIDSNVYVYKHEKYKFDPTFLSFQAKNILFRGSKVCPMTEFSGAGDKIDFVGNTLVLGCENNEYVNISGLEFFQFKTDDKIIDYISLMCNNMTPYTFAIAEKFTYSISTQYKFIENDKIKEGTSLNTTNNNLDLFGYHLEKSGENSFKTLEHTQLHSFYFDSEENAEDEDDVLVEENVEGDDLIETN